MDILERLKAVGVDVENSLNRFAGNKDLYLRFLMKFPLDPNAGLLGEAMEAGNYEEAQRCAHTLKGVSANLGMNELSSACADLVAHFRARDAEGLEPLFEKLNTSYQEIIDAINQP